jgi:hypothetical protein
MATNEPLTAAEERIARRVADYVLRQLRGQSMPEQQYYSIAQAAAILGISQNTLRRKHNHGFGPKVTKLPNSNLVRFSAVALSEWLQLHAS